MSYRSDRSDVVGRIKSSISMRAAADEYGLEITRGGYTSCPFHTEKTPSLRIYDEPGRGFFCFGCQSGGSVIDFVMLLLNLEFAPAVIRLATDFNIPIELDDNPQTRAEAQAARARETERRRQRNRYLGLCDEHRRVTNVIHLFRPESEAEEWLSSWCAAVKRLPVLVDEIEGMEAAGYGR